MARCADGITAGVLVPYEAFCYQIVSESVPRQTASERCTSGGGTLAVLPTNASLTTVGNKVKTESESGVISSSVFWLGMNNTRGRILSDNANSSSCRIELSFLTLLVLLVVWIQ
uniref:C-type lectin domain-containing protein n=1 Tax=Magallana gigas TaxID=29159 RepID=K1R7L3_MAGGI